MKKDSATGSLVSPVFLQNMVTDEGGYWEVGAWILMLKILLSFLVLSIPDVSVVTASLSSLHHILHSWAFCSQL